MKQYVCSVCSYTYDESIGIPEAGIAPGTKWDDLPSDWKCPWCGAGKEAFKEKGAAAAAAVLLRCDAAGNHLPAAAGMSGRADRLV